MKLYRPHIPLGVRCMVAERQLEAAVGALPTNEFGVIFRDDPKSKLKPRLGTVLFHLARIFECDVSDIRLDHDPPLGARRRRGEGKNTVYTPAANDPDHLRYRPHGPQFDGSHLIKTNVRGDHGQYPDRVLIKRERRRQKAEAAHNGAHKTRIKTKTSISRKISTHAHASKFPKRRPRVKLASDSATKLSLPKRKWPSRPFPTGRKFNSRANP